MMLSRQLNAVRIDNLVLYRFGNGAGLCLTPMHRYRGYENLPLVATGSRRLDNVLAYLCLDGRIRMEDLFNNYQVRAVLEPHCISGSFL